MADDLLSAAEIEVLTGKRPESLGMSLDPQRVAQLEAIHEHAARQFASELSSLLRRTVRVRHVGAECLPSAVYVARLEPGAYCQPIVATPQTDPWLLSIPPGTLYSIVDYMLGGGRDTQVKVRRPPTDIELRLVGRAANLFLHALQSAWQGTTALELKILDGDKVPAVDPHPASHLHCAHFALEFAGTQGEMCLGMPVNILNELLASTKDGVASRNLPSAAGEVPQALVELVACLAEAEITPEELAGLAVGDIITTEQSATAPISVAHEGELKFHARLGSWRGHKAVEIEHVLPDADRSPDPSPPEA